MILLTAFVVIAGVLVSWNVEKMTKEFYFLLILLSLGRLWFLYFTRSFHTFLLPRNSSDTKIFADRYLGKREKRIQRQ